MSCADDGDQALENYKELLTYVKSAVSRNYSEKSINNMLDYIEKNSSSDNAESTKYLPEFYSETLASFQATNNERLWLKTNIKLARLHLERKDYAFLMPLVREMHKACENEDGTEDVNKGTQLLEIYAMEIQMYADTHNTAQLKTLYEKALKVKSAVPHPKVMGIIRECGGKMHMSEENWKDAQSDFFESFRNYDEAGSLQRIQVLKYLVLTTMLMKSDINPFESQETKPYKNDKRISGMTKLVDAYQRDDIAQYESVLARNKDLLDDPFIAENIGEITRNMRTKAALKLIAPYTRFKLSTVARQLKISEKEVQDILSYLVIEGRIKARINEAAGTVEMEDQSDAERIQAWQAWSKAVGTLVESVWMGEGFKEMGVDPKVGLGAGVPPENELSFAGENVMTGLDFGAGNRPFAPRGRSKRVAGNA